MNPDAPLCYKCKSEISADSTSCNACDAPVLFNTMNESVVEFMTERTHPHMIPRSDNG